MKIILSIIIVLTLFQFRVTNAGEQPKNKSMLVSSGWLNGHLGDSNLVIFHIGTEEIYSKNHIPGAQWISLKSLLVENKDLGLSDEMPSIENIRSFFEERGVSNNSKIILYWAREWDMPYVTRIFLSLDYIGLGSNTALLDGGFMDWTSEEYGVSTANTEVLNRSIMRSSAEAILVDSKWINERLRNSSIAVIDGRPDPYYTGNSVVSHLPRQGHIAGAISIPLTEVIDAEEPHMFKSIKELRMTFSDEGIRLGDTLVTYCNTGIWASQIYFAAKYAGYDVRLYDGSFEDWSSNKDLPVIEPVKRKLFK